MLAEAAIPMIAGRLPASVKAKLHLAAGIVRLIALISWGVSVGASWLRIRIKYININTLLLHLRSLLRYHPYFKFRGFERLALVEAAAPIEPHTGLQSMAVGPETYLP